MPIQKTELTTKIEKLKALQAETERLQGEIVSQRPTELAGLHVAYGFEDVNAFLKAVKEAVANAPKGKAKKAAKAAKATKVAGKSGRPKKEKAAAAAKPAGKRGRARITEEIKVQVQTLVAEGKSGAAISKLLGISLPSVQNIKKASGLVKARSKSVATPVAVVEAPVAEPVVIVPAPVSPDASAN